MLEARTYTVIVEVFQENVGSTNFTLPKAPDSKLPPVLPSLAQVVASGIDGLYYSDLVYVQPQRGLALNHLGKTYLVLDEEYILAKYVGVDVDQDGNVVQSFELVEECPF